MQQEQQLRQLIEQNKGVIKTAHALAAGVDKPFLYKYIMANRLERIAHGIYVTEDAWVDSLYVLHLRSEQAVFSHKSALLLHGMTDKEPAHPSITVKSGYNPSHFAAEGIQVYTVKQGLLNLGKTTAKTQFGHMVPAYDVERTICDVIRSRNKLEFQTVQGALKAFVGRKNKDLNLLMRYAALFGVECIIMGYMSMLL